MADYKFNDMPEIMRISLSLLEENKGQMEGLPSNPRIIERSRFGQLKESITRSPQFLKYNPLKVYPLDKGKYIIIGGNMRYKALKELGWTEAPCCVLPGNTPMEKLREMVIQDNNHSGKNDWDILANEWDSEELEEWGLDVWQEPKEDNMSEQMEKTKWEESDKPDFFAMMLGDRLYDSGNDFDIPNLRIDGQPTSGLLLPFAGWGADTRVKKGVSTYHFYVDDYRFAKIWNNPASVLESGCTELVEPNTSLFDTTPVAYGLQQIYMKRWIARFWQECGAKVYADLNVSRKFYKYNRLGIPDGYNAFATRGYADRQEYLKMEIQTAREISGKDNPNMIVYGGGEKIRELCLQNNVIYVEQFMTNRVKKGR